MLLKQPLSNAEQLAAISDGRVKFQFHYAAGDMLDGLDALNDAACDAFGNHMLQDLGFKVIGIVETEEVESTSYVEGTLCIEVDAMLDVDDVNE